MIVLTKDNTETPAAYSAGDDSDPVSVTFSLDGSGIPASVTLIPATDLFVWANNHTATIGSYTGVTAEITGDDPGIVWELSLDGATEWSAALTLTDFDVSASFQALQIFARATATNDGSLETNNYVAAKVTIAATERPL